MLGFIGGLLLGAILGVAADRLWERFEKRVRVDVRFSFYQHVSGDQGLTCTVVNRGKANLPPHRVCIFSQARGRLYLFNRKKDGALMPGQEVEHTCSVNRVDHGGSMILRWIDHHDPSVKDPATLSTYVLRLEMEDSKVPLFECTRLGTVLVRVLADCARAKSTMGVSFEDANALQHLTRDAQREERDELRRLEKRTGVELIASPWRGRTRALWKFAAQEAGKLKQRLRA